MFLLDTNVVSALRRLERADANVRAWSLATPAAFYAISVVTVLELTALIVAVAISITEQVLRSSWVMV